MTTLPGLQIRDAVTPTVLKRRFSRIRNEAEGCRRCELWQHATQTVFGEGPVPARLMLVGEQPGDHEDLEGRPFVGPAGRILAEALELAGIDREATFVTNVVKHFRWRPSPNGKRRLHEKPTKANVTACHVWVEKELELVQPEVLVGMGVAVMRDRGQHVASELAPTVLVTIHPSAVLRARDDRDEMFDGFVRDLRVAAEALGSRA